MTFKGIVAFVLIWLITGYAGWLTGQRSIQSLPEGHDNWTYNIENEGSKMPYYKTAGKKIRASNLLITKTEDRKALQDDEVIKNTPDFPSVLAISSDPKDDWAHILHDNAVLTVRAGDILDSGWKIEAISFTKVVADYEGEKTDFYISDNALDEIQ